MARSRYCLRPIASEEWTALGELQALAFHRRYDPDHFAVFRDTLELDRVLAAYDGDTMVASSAVHTMSLTTPGATVPAAGLTVCTVHPSHRGKGLLTALMTRLHADFADDGEPVSILWAKEASIYGRYGYASACTRTAIDLDQHRASLATSPFEESGRLRRELAAPADVQAEMAGVYERLRPTRPGYVGRTHAAWRDWLHEPAHDGRRAATTRTLLVRDGTDVRGYALFDVLPGDDELMPSGQVRVREVHALDPPAYIECWLFLTTLALTEHVTASNLPVDAPLFSLLADPRRARRRHTDGLWTRLIRLGEALSHRRYAAPIDIVLDVTDRRCPWNAGTWRLAGDQGGATCERTSSPADIRIDTAALASAYLGESSLAAYVTTGRALEHRPGGLLRLAAAMSWDPRPWCPHRF